MHTILPALCLSALAGSLIGCGKAEHSPSRQMQPYFDINTPLNVSAHIGKSAFLTCIVHNVGNMSVSWVRHRDIHILTVGAYTYTSDQRFMSLHKKESNEWTLQIKWVQKRDSGMYECQVSSIPVQSLFVQLSVVVPSAVIHGTPDVHIEHGSTINLTCSINYGTEPPAYIFWYHHDKSGKVAVVNYDSDRGGISVITVKAEVSTSHLVIRGAKEADAGKYYCSPSNADVAYVHVHVHSSKGPSAIQTSMGTLGNSYFFMVFAMVTLTLNA
ncbi:zwei Ig domain protein zig-8-like [Cimex lectularius]|uniref:Ig-like domain-containing protein n=1 Tax=Cimex lectularius TaxID=79782 RepID=A0A8I6R949_CIMLE|nr:zwei Ig domain protein zig-8-like [Cimex lectularius]